MTAPHDVRPPGEAAGGRLRRWYRQSLVGHPVGRDFRQLWIGDTIGQVGTQVGTIALPLLAVSVLGAGEWEMGLLATSENLAFLLVGLPAGAWVDRMRKRHVLVWGDVVRGVALLSLPAAWLLGVLSFPLVLAVAVVMGVATVFFDVAYQSYLPSLVPSSRISEGNARLQVSHSAAQVAGPGLGGGLVGLVGAPLVLLADAVSFLGSVVFTLRIRHREEPPPREGRRPLHVEIGEGLGFVLRQPLLRRIVATTALSNFASNIGGALLVLYVVRDLGLSEAQLGLVLSVGAIGGLVGAVASGAVMRLLGEGRTIALVIVPASGAAALVPLAAGRDTVVAFALLAVSMAVYGFGVVVYNVAQVSFRQRLCPAPLLGRMNASVRFIVWGVTPIGAFVGGVVGAQAGILTALWLGVALELVAVLPVLLSPLLRMRDLPRGLDAHAAAP
ncbi:MFS transporter [Aquipuribacter nitratireducens]|uniref:MFS transporter n=1 Tax=Aquipuribacter nitratireducens TaxID=650104 RepID=A0ABW0GR74_9MICO